MSILRRCKHCLSVLSTTARSGAVICNAPEGLDCFESVDRTPHRRQSGSRAAMIPTLQECGSQLQQRECSVEMFMCTGLVFGLSIRQPVGHCSARVCQQGSGVSPGELFSRVSFSCSDCSDVRMATTPRNSSPMLRHTGSSSALPFSNL